MRVELFFAFIDLSGFTRFTEVHGDEAAVAVLSDFRSVVREVASDHGVRVAKWLGDGAMFCATDAPAVITTVLEIEERTAAAGTTLPLRAGIAGGPVILFDGDDYIGGPVNLASRLCDAADPYEVLAADDLAVHVPDWAFAQAIEPRELLGFVTPVPVVRITVSTRQRRALGIPLTDRKVPGGLADGDTSTGT
jgi:adenylate cyclase